MPRTTETITISIPPEMAAELARVQKAEHRTRSELVREALRQYFRTASVASVAARARELREEEPFEDEIDAVAAGRREGKTSR